MTIYSGKEGEKGGFSTVFKRREAAFTKYATLNVGNSINNVRTTSEKRGRFLLKIDIREFRAFQGRSSACSTASAFGATKRKCAKKFMMPTMKTDPSALSL